MSQVISSLPALALYSALVSSLYCAPSVTAQQPESPIACDEGNEPVELSYGDHTVDCEIGDAVDLDRFSFQGAVGDNVRIVVLSRTNGFDPLLEVRGPLGDVIAQNSCSGTNRFGNAIRCSFSVEWVLEAEGPYSLTLSDSAFDERGDYILNVERLRPLDPSPRLAYDCSTNDEINPPTDSDFFFFEGAENTDVRVILRSRTNGFDPLLEVRDPQGRFISDAEDAVISRNSCSGTNRFGNPIMCTLTIDLPLTESGTYFAVISDSAFDEPGGYSLSLQCVFGDCPPNTFLKEFVRGDSNADNSIDLTDAIFLLEFLFQGGDAPSCEDATDANDDGKLDLADAIYTLEWAFSGGDAPPSPTPSGTSYSQGDCGIDCSPDLLGCEAFTRCQASSE